MTTHDDLLEAARSRTGLDDFGDDSFREIEAAFNVQATSAGHFTRLMSPVPATGRSPPSHSKSAPPKAAVIRPLRMRGSQ